MTVPCSRDVTAWRVFLTNQETLSNLVNVTSGRVISSEYNPLDRFVGPGAYMGPTLASVPPSQCGQAVTLKIPFEGGGGDVFDAQTNSIVLEGQEDFFFVILSENLQGQARVGAVYEMLDRGKRPIDTTEVEPMSNLM